MDQAIYTLACFSGLVVVFLFFVLKRLVLELFFIFFFLVLLATELLSISV